MSLQNRILHYFKHYQKNIAISHGEKRINYGTLGDKALKIASFLSKKKIQNQCIGIQIEDPVLHIYAILGVLLSKNFYLSITPDNAFFLSNQDQLPVQAVLYQKTLSEKKEVQSESFDLNDVLEDSVVPVFVADQFDYQEEDNCCVFSTSGSTGTPKLVIHSIKNIWNDTMRQIEDNNIEAKDNIDFLFSFTFSASLACIFPALLTGARLSVYNIKKEGISQIPSFWENNAITFSTLSVSSFRAISKLLPTLKHLESLRLISIGAEPVFQEDIELFREKYPTSTILQVAYATTEVRTISEYKFSNASEEIPNFINSVGQPVRSKEVLILSEEGKILPPNAVGEIVVKSAFIAQPYKTEKQTEIGLFKTGDLGYFNSKGYLYYTGRKQQEVKINGIKIDLFSIEKEVEKNDKIQQAVAVIKTTNSERKTITICIESGVEIDTKAIKEQLSLVLPISHLPHTFYQLDHFPLTHTGKINRKVLEALVNDKDQNSETNKPTELKAPTLENSIVKIWNEVLGIHHTDLDSDFFNDLGGDSLRSMICLAEIEKQLKIQLPNHAILSCRTPYYLTKYIDYNLFEEYVSIAKINTFVSGRRTIYFLDLYTDNTFQDFINPNLSAQYNLAYIHYDIYSHSYREDLANQLLTKMKEVIDKEGDAIVMGYCFSGYLAFQLAAIAPNISLIVMFDTPNYFEYTSYTNENRLQVAKTILYRTLKEGDFMCPLYLAKRTAKQYLATKKVSENNATTENNNYVESINYILENTNNKLIKSDCLFVKSTRSYLRNIHHGYNWKAYVEGNFHLLNLPSRDVETLKGKFSKKITKQLMQIS